MTLAFVAGLFSLSTITPTHAQEAKETEEVRKKSGPIAVNGMVAKVNGDVITMNELMIKVAPLQSVLMARSPRRGPAYEKQLLEIRLGILDELIDRTIIFTEFKDRVRAFPDEDIEAEVKRIVQNVYNGDEELFRQYLKATNLTRDQFKEQQRKELLVQIVRSQHFGDVPPPTDAELRKEYKPWAVANRDRTKDVCSYKRIYLRKDLGDGPEAQLTLAEDAYAKIKAGEETFENMAKLYSNDSRAEDGGLWTDIPATDLNRDFCHFLFGSKINDVIGPIEDNFGYNIIQVTEQNHGPAEKSFEDARDLMKRRVDSEKKKANFEKWMKKMRSRAIIQKMIK